MNPTERLASARRWMTKVATTAAKALALVLFLLIPAGLYLYLIEVLNDPISRRILEVSGFVVALVVIAVCVRALARRQVA